MATYSWGPICSLSYFKFDHVVEHEHFAFRITSDFKTFIQFFTNSIKDRLQFIDLGKGSF